jgi:hypothetical protein
MSEGVEMADLFAGPTPEELQMRRLDHAKNLLGEVQEKLEMANSAVPGKLPLDKIENLKKKLAEIDAQIDDLKQKIC